MHQNLCVTGVSLLFDAAAHLLRQPVAVRLCPPLVEELDRRGGPASAQLCRTAAGLHRAPAPLPPQPGGGAPQQPGVHPTSGAAGAQEAGRAAGGESPGVLPRLGISATAGTVFIHTLDVRLS